MAQSYLRELVRGAQGLSLFAPQQLGAVEALARVLQEQDAASAAARGLTGSSFEIAQLARRRQTLVDLARVLSAEQRQRVLAQQQLGLSAAELLERLALQRAQLREQQRARRWGVIGDIFRTVGQVAAAAILA